jgi:hypothetical protein
VWAFYSSSTLFWGRWILEGRVGSIHGVFSFFARNQMILSDVWNITFGKTREWTKQFATID